MHSGWMNLYVLLLIKFVGNESTASLPLPITMSFIFDSIRLTESLATYMHARFQWYLSQGPLPGPAPPVEMEIQIAIECEVMAMKAAEAFRKRGALHDSCFRIELTSQLSPGVLGCGPVCGCPGIPAIRAWGGGGTIYPESLSN
jgi:hypothetical protein